MGKRKLKIKKDKETREIILKISFAIILPLLTFIALDFIDYSNNMFAAIFFFSALIYTVPFWITALNIKKSGRDKIAPVMLNDFLCLYVVALFTSLVLDLINAIRFNLTDFTGVTTLILSLIYLLVFLFSMLLYIYMNKSNKKKTNLMEIL